MLDVDEESGMVRMCGHHGETFDEWIPLYVTAKEPTYEALIEACKQDAREVEDDKKEWEEKMKRTGNAE